MEMLLLQTWWNNTLQNCFIFTDFQAGAKQSIKYIILNNLQIHNALTVFQLLHLEKSFLLNVLFLC